MNSPIYQEIIYCDAFDLVTALSDQEGILFLDSAMLFPHCGRYSFIGIDPFGYLMSKNGIINFNGKLVYDEPFEFLRHQLNHFKMETLPGLPPFQGGIAGYFAYDLYQHLESIVSNQQDDMDFPDLMLGFYDVVLAFDHEVKKAWLISTGCSFTEEKNVAQRRLDQWMKKLTLLMKNKQRTSTFPSTPIKFDFTKENYCQAVERVRQYILEGDIFEANLSQRFRADLPVTHSAFDLYSILRHINPAPFAAYFKMQDCVIASASPERFLKMDDRKVETRPIKGTHKRGKTTAEDAAFAETLLRSEKDRAENIMIVDLLRNDLSKVCEYDSVHVPQLCELETYPSVHHLVSVVTATLRQEYDAIDLLKATFPGGSITGAPKIRAMEIIAELEPTCRGPYCGSVGYIGFDGTMDTSITIRTFAIKNNHITFQAGGAIVLDSDPEAEYSETLTKAKALMRSLNDIADR